MTVERPGAGRLRVLAVGHTAELGGAELALTRLSAALLDRPEPQVELRVVLLADGPLVERLASTGVPVTVLPADPDLVNASRGALAAASSRNVRRLLAAVRAVVRLRRVVRSERPDVVHTTTLKTHVLGLAAGWLAGVPVVWQVHDRIAEDYLPRPLVHLLRMLARRGPLAVVANSRVTAATLPGVRDLTVAYPGFAPGQALAHVPATRPRAPRVVGLVGRLSPTKGQLELVRAAPDVLTHHPDCRFRCIGAATFGAEDYAQEVVAEIRRLGLGDHVEVTGFVDDPAAALDELTVCVHASPVPEPFGQVVVEAMVRGVPVVATDAGGVPEILTDRDGHLGRLVPPGDPDALARAIVATLDDEPAALAVARRAHAVALQRFAVATTAERLTEVWWRASSRPRVRARLRRG